MQIINTIIPIFAVILLGMIARKKGFIPDAFLEPANKLVFYLAIPAMVFKAIATASLKTQLNIQVIIITMVSVISGFLLAWLFAKLINLKQGTLSTFVQNAFHGNLGYVGLAVSFYYLGEQGLVKASIITGFVMILQNFLSVSILSFYSGTSESRNKIYTGLLKMIGNPIIVSAICGLVFATLNIPIPVIVDRSLKIIGSMALPTALLIIGASLSFELMRTNLKKVFFSGIIKIIFLPAIGYTIFYILNIPKQDYIPALILLSAPSATVTFVMAKEMNGNPDLAVAGISSSTLISAITFTIWLHLGT